ncbi:MAG: hypothetical protein WAL20_17045, partial [Rhodomicrobium sp.]
MARAEALASLSARVAWVSQLPEPFAARSQRQWLFSSGNGVCMRVLIVEDDRTAADFLAKALA